ncbi:hypothetical protein EZ449_12085 [Pedobacter frigidisoli]|uniref:Uncharacterized protein n=1 Tax=Pedobacter frigidisoli TaxID=2530455 RepID=A0A4R0P6H9_9SPHI|nr:hypothetical protein [Pedobacter frigidisoli]TCD08573.1 hypothetical protein EZ449_12085 [Pedobacter frigidisoli]
MNTLFSFAQSSKISDGIKQYIAIIKTKDDKFKGLFVKIDSHKVILYSKDKYQEVTTSDVKSIKLRVTKASYELQSYIFKYVKKEDPKEYQYTNQRGESVDKWGREKPTTNEEIAGAVAGAIVGTALEGVANVVVGSLHNINPSIANYKFRKEFDFAQLETISYYSVYYQQNPNTLAELKKLKELSANFKP